MALFYPAAVKIDSTYLTDQGRSAVEISRNSREVKKELASGKIKKYFKGNVKRTFSTSWSWLPDQDADTIDGYAGRETMETLLGESQVIHVLTLYDDLGGAATYNVWVENYSERLIRRDAGGNRFFWEVTLALEEQ